MIGFAMVALIVWAVGTIAWLRTPTAGIVSYRNEREMTMANHSADDQAAWKAQQDKAAAQLEQQRQAKAKADAAQAAADAKLPDYRRDK